MEWARNNTAWRLLEDGRICVRPKDLMAVVDECNRYRKALEEIASNESAVNAERADGIAITALAFENRENTRRHEA
jgi:ferric-dicitrate binding protein FerR (iron transport regulator)